MHHILLAQVVPASQVQANLGWVPPGIGGVLTFLIRFFFVIAGLAALFMLLLGALAWITSGGSKEQVEKAREKIVSAVVGVLMMVMVLSVAATLERVVFNCHICFGLTCDITIPSIIEPRAAPTGCDNPGALSGSGGIEPGVGGGPEISPNPTATPSQKGSSYVMDVGSE